jgi:hypothetical protein
MIGPAFLTNFADDWAVLLINRFSGVVMAGARVRTVLTVSHALRKQLKQLRRRPAAPRLVEARC